MTCAPVSSRTSHTQDFKFRSGAIELRNHLAVAVPRVGIIEPVLQDDSQATPRTLMIALNCLVTSLERIETLPELLIQPGHIAARPSAETQD